MLITLLKYAGITIAGTFVLAFAVWLGLAFYYFFKLYYDAWKAKQER